MDLTVIFLTENKLPEKWVKLHQKKLKEAAKGYELITISRKPLPSTTFLQTEPSSPSNVYRQMLKAAKMAKTEYVAVAEDDCLYPPDHFKQRPERFGYNMHRWTIFTWGDPLYSWRDRYGNFSYIGKTDFTVEALEERFAKYPNGTPRERTGEIGRWRTDTLLGVTHHKPERFWSQNAIINISHQFGLDDRSRRKRKCLGPITALDVPYWGKAQKYQKLWT